MIKIIKDEMKLSQRLPEFNVIESKQLLLDMKAEVKKWFEANPEVSAIAVNQLGFDLRVFALVVSRDKDLTIEYFCNPMIVKQRGLHIAITSDASLGDREFLVARNDEIVLDYQTVFGTNEEIKCNAESGGDMIQQLVQRLDGVSVADLGLEIHEDFKKASEAEQQEVIEYYLDSLKKQQEALQADIDNDAEAKEIQDAIKFITKAAAGEIEIQMPEPIMPKVGRKERRKLQRKGLLDTLVDKTTGR
jgi:peptide deformylase